MRGHVSNELDVGVPAEDVWAVYSSPEVPKLILEILPDFFERVDIVKEDGGVGTILHIVLAQGLAEPRSWKEKYVKIDNKERVKVARQIEGGYLDMGFHLFEFIFNIVEKDAHSCIIRSTTTFELDDKFEANASLVNATFLWKIAKAIANYVMQKKANVCNT